MGSTGYATATLGLLATSAILGVTMRESFVQPQSPVTVHLRNEVKEPQEALAVGAGHSDSDAQMPEKDIAKQVPTGIKTKKASSFIPKLGSRPWWRKTRQEITKICTSKVNTALPLRRSSGKGFCWRGTLDRENRVFLKDFLPPMGELDGGEECVQCKAGIKSLQGLMAQGCADIDNAKCGKASDQFGFGALVNSMVKTATVALVKSEPFVWANFTGLWGGGKDHPETIKPTAYFNKDAVQCHKHCAGGSTRKKGRDVVFIDTWKQQCVPNAPCRQSRLSVESVNAELAAARSAEGTRYEDVFWWNAELMQMLMTPNEAVAKIVEEQKRKMGFDEHESVLGVHVRMGDSCAHIPGANKGRQCDGLKPVLARVKQMVEQYGYKGVLVVTDEAQVKIDAQKALGNLAKVMTTTLGTPVFKDKKGKPIVIDKASFDNADVLGQEFLAESIILASCDGFIGKFTSNVFRNAYTLASIRDGKNCLHPVMSLDSPYCMDYGMQVNYNCHTGVASPC